VVDVEADHLGGAPSGAAALDGAGRAVADLQKAHQAGTGAAAGEGLAFAANAREVGARAGSILEETRLADPEVHETAFADEIVIHALNEASVNLWVGVSVGRDSDLTRRGVDVVVTLGRTSDAVGVIEAGVEPLRRIGRGHLGDEHVDQLIFEGLSVFPGREIGVSFAPPAPARGEPANHLLSGALGTEHRHVVVVELLNAGGIELRHAGFPKVFRDHDVRRDLRPGGGNLGVFHFKDDGTVGVGDARGALAPLNTGERVGCGLGEAPVNDESRLRAAGGHMSFSMRSAENPRG